MTTATLLMLGFGVAAFLIGVTVLTQRGGSEPARVARRIAGTMTLALGVVLALFAIGLPEAVHA